jgi:hypothetical protein
LFIANASMFRNSRSDLVKQVEKIEKAPGVRTSAAAAGADRR